MNRNFPRDGPNGIEAYIGSSYVLISEGGMIIPLERNGFGNADSITSEIAAGLRKLQDKGFEIRGDVHPLFEKPRDIQGDVEFYQAFPGDADYLLNEHGVNIVYRKEAA